MINMQRMAMRKGRQGHSKSMTGICWVALVEGARDVVKVRWNFPGKLSPTQDKDMVH